MASKGGAGVSITGQDWARAGGAGPEVRAEGAGPEGGDLESSGSKVGDDYVDEEDLSGLSVEAGWGSCTVVFRRIATLEYKVENCLKL